jgi:hypothetical protein
VLARLAVPYVDVAAADLCWSLDAVGLAPLATVEVPVGRASVRLAVLGASHQVVATLGAATCAEAVACGVPGAPLPGSAWRDLAGLRYRFTSTVLHLTPAELAGRTERLRTELAADARALVAAFPGHAEAVTALAVRGHGPGVRWRTWHAYPRTGELVVTASHVVPR